MQEPYKEGLANHVDPESCAGGREAAGEALTGAHTGQPSSSEITFIGVPTPCYEGEGHRPDGASREPTGHAAESKTLGMCENSMRENWETPALPSTDGGEGRPEKAAGHTPGMYRAGESDDLVVPAKRTNQVGQPATAESVEGRGSTKGNVFAVGRAPDAAPDQRVDRLEGVRQVARRDKQVRLTALLHHVTPQLLFTSFYQLKHEASPGVDGLTWQE